MIKVLIIIGIQNNLNNIFIWSSLPVNLLSSKASRICRTSQYFLVLRKYFLHNNAMFLPFAFFGNRWIPFIHSVSEKFNTLIHSYEITQNSTLRQPRLSNEFESTYSRKMDCSSACQILNNNERSRE